MPDSNPARIEAGPSGTRFGEIRWFDRIDSTNGYVLEQARLGAGEGLVAVADHQSAGRGRLGRRWQAPPGKNLLVSVLLRPSLPMDQRYLACAVVTLAAAEAIEALADVAPIIKWPNDLLAPHGGKLAGVLAESDDEAIVVGIGINVNWPGPDDQLPPELAGMATSLAREAAKPVERELLLMALLRALEPRVADLAGAQGRRTQADDLRQRCGTVGSQVRVELSDETLVGMATGITDHGHLEVAVGTSVRTVIAGDVVHLRPDVAEPFEPPV